MGRRTVRTLGLGRARLGFLPWLQLAAWPNA